MLYVDVWWVWLEVVFVYVVLRMDDVVVVIVFD